MPTLLNLALGSRWRAHNGSGLVYTVTERDDNERRAELTGSDGTRILVDYEWFERRGVQL